MSTQTSQAPWRSQPGGGPILINPIHEIGNLRSLCGDITAVQAMASHASRGLAVEDTTAIVLRFANGALGSFVLSDTAASARSWEQTSGENPAYDSHDDEDCYLVAGTPGQCPRRPAEPSRGRRHCPVGAQRLPGRGSVT